MVYYPNIWINHQSQYRWFQVVYQVGVFVSRSSGNIIHLENMWWMPFWQFLNIFYFLFEVMFPFTPNIWISFVMVFWVGMQGGLAYVNTFFRMVKEVPVARQNFALAAVTVAESIGIALAGVIAIPVHDVLCKSRWYYVTTTVNMFSIENILYILNLLKKKEENKRNSVLSCNGWKDAAFSLLKTLE